MRVLLVVSLLMTLGFAGAPVAAQELPAIPDPVPVTLERETTALLMLDFQEGTCLSRPACVESLPTIVALFDWARAGGLWVFHSGTMGGVPLPEAARLPDEPVVISSANKFFNTDLDELLRERGIRTLVMAGTTANGAVLYTSFGATSRGYTVVVAEDGISSPNDFQTFLTRYQLLNQPGFANPNNMPLQANAVTLSRSDLLAIQ